MDGVIAIISISINGNEVTGTARDLAELLALVDMAGDNATARPAKTKAAKTKATKAAKPKREKPVMTASETRVADNAIARLKAAGFECKARKQGTWLWVYPTDGQGRTEEFKAVSLPKGWKHSMKRGAFRRVMS